MKPEDIFELKHYDPKTNDLWCFLRWDISKNVYVSLPFRESKETLEALAYGKLWQKYGDEIIEHICTYATGPSF